MDIKDISALVQIRNYAFSVREDRNIFKGPTYAKVTEQIGRIDKFLSTVLTEEDLVNMALVTDSPKKASTKKKPPFKGQKKEEDAKYEVSDSDSSDSSDSQISLNFKENPDKDLSSDGDADMIAAAIAKQKEKIAGKRK
jgi:hypothetical protein